jgi:hypothetical protein
MHPPLRLHRLLDRDLLVPRFPPPRLLMDPTPRPRVYPIPIDALEVFRFRMPGQLLQRTPDAPYLEVRAAWDSVDGVLHVTESGDPLDWYVLALSALVYAVATGGRSSDA